METVIPENTSLIKVAVVEDDRDLNDILSENFIRHGYNTHQIYSGAQAVTKIIGLNPDLVILDWVLPGLTGEEICKDLRNNGFRNSIIMLTGQKDDEKRISAYGFGVTTFVEKPFNMEILMAICKNHVRKSPPSQKDIEFCFHDLVYYPQINMVLRDRTRIELTVMENLVLSYLYQNPNRVISKLEIEQNIWNSIEEARSRSLDMHIMRLRKKIEINPKWPKIIITLKGKGILFKNP